MGAAPSTILVVDDHEATRVLTQRWLEEAGYATESAGNGIEALERVAAGNIDLVVLDIVMPEMDGLEALTALRRDYAMTELPVIMLTAREDAEEVTRALRLGANDYELKPADHKVLLKRVATHLALVSGEGKNMAGYRILGKLGSGGMGSVYRAHQPNTGLDVALKVLPRSITVNDEIAARFVREARLAARFNHPNVIRVLDVGEDEGIHFIVMELAEGRTIRDWADAKPMVVGEALKITRQVASGLAAMYRGGVIHRDIKPENILVTDSGSAKIADFGIAREARRGRRITRTGVGVGNAIYASPEQFEGAGDHRSDIYSLGATLYLMITGEDPYPLDLDIESVLRLKRSGPPKWPTPHVPAPVRALVARMMQPAPRRRFQDYAALEGAIADASVGRMVSVPKPSNRLRWLVLVGSLVAAAGAAWWFSPALRQLIRSATGLS